MKRLVAALLSVASALTVFSPAAEARVPDKTPKRLLEARVRRTLSSGPARAATAGIIVMRGQRTLMAANAEMPLAPASLLKLATTAAAMKRYGPDHRFTTSAVATIAPKAGVLVGPLVLVGGGDPTLATATYRAERFIGKPKPDDPHPIPAFRSGSATIEDLAARVARAGVRRVVGDLIVDATLFDAVRTQPGWIASYLGADPETGYLEALTINEGFTDHEAKAIVASPALAAGSALKSALARRGVAITGTVRRGRAAVGAQRLAAVQSPPISEIVFYTNRWSVNYAAEFLLKNLGASFGSGGTTAAGAQVVRQTLAELGVPVDGLRQADGSGLSLQNRMSPRTVAGLVRHFLTETGAAGDALRTSLPVAAGPGTLFKRFRQTEAAGNLRAKTGTIRGVRSLAGWVTSADGVPIVFVMMFNNATRPSLLTSPLDFLGVMLTHYPGR